MMAVETFVYIYIAAFAVSTIVAVTLLIAAARHISRFSSQGYRDSEVTRTSREREQELLKSWSADD
jgi:predicted thioredoxin/glutaredoxin